MSNVKRKSISRKLRSSETRVVRVKTEGSGLGALKTLVVMGLIFLELAVMIYLYIEMALAFRWYMLFSFVASGLTCLYVLSSNKNSLSKAVWIIFLLVGFAFGYVIYIMSDERIFFKSAKKKYKKIFDDTNHILPESNSDIYDLKPAVLNDAKYLHNAGGFISCKNTATEYYPSGAELFDNILEDCRRAEKFIFIEFFIIADGTLFNRFFDVLSERASAGVDVRIIYDDMGSHRTLSRKTKDKIKKAGINLLCFNRLVPIFSVGLNFRDHRKIVVIDGCSAYSGGSNFADEYVNEKRMYGYWKDTGIKLVGEAVDSLSLIFLRQWAYLSDRKEDVQKFFGHSASPESESLVIPFADGLDYPGAIGKNVYENMIASAENFVYIMTPYFICDDIITGLLMNKAMSGVDVRIILPGVPDKAFVYGVSRNNLEKLSEYGVKAYVMDDAFVHSKLVLTENAVVVGSINMDLRSFYQQFEVGVYTNDPQTMEKVKLDFEESFQNSSDISVENGKKRNVFKRIAAGVLQLFAPFM